jgi:hypothetical protein
VPYKQEVVGSSPAGPTINPMSQAAHSHKLRIPRILPFTAVWPLARDFSFIFLNAGDSIGVGPDDIFDRDSPKRLSEYFPFCPFAVAFICKLFFTLLYIYTLCDRVNSKPLPPNA